MHGNICYRIFETKWSKGRSRIIAAGYRSLKNGPDFSVIASITTIQKDRARIVQTNKTIVHAIIHLVSSRPQHRFQSPE
jgi:hypothetical protein